MYNKPGGGGFSGPAGGGDFGVPQSEYQPQPQPQPQQSTQQGNYQGQTQPEGTAGINAYTDLYNAGVIEPNNANIDQQVNSLNTQLGLISAGNRNQADLLNKNAGFSEEGNNLSRDDLNTRQGAVNRQVNMLAPNEALQQRRFGSQQGDIDFSKGQLGQYEDISHRSYGAQREQMGVGEHRQLRSAERNAAVRGGLQTQGYSEQVHDIVQDLNFALGNLGRQEEQTNLGFKGQHHSLETQQGLLQIAKEQHGLDQEEKTAQLKDANAYLATQGKRLNLSDRQIRSNLQNALDQLGLNNALSVEQVALQIAAVEQGRFSPIGGLLQTITGAAGLTRPGGGGGSGGASPGGGPSTTTRYNDYGYNTASVHSAYDRAAAEKGLTPQEKANMAKLVEGESGFQNTPQMIHDVNTDNGTPAFGPAQMIEPTFRAYADPGHTDWHNPYDNFLASINYQRKKYGRILSKPGY